MKNAEKIAFLKEKLNEKHISILRYLFLITLDHENRFSLEPIEMIGRQLKLYGIRALSKSQSLKYFFELYELSLIEISPRPPILSTSKARLAFWGNIFIRDYQCFHDEKATKEFYLKYGPCWYDRSDFNEEYPTATLYSFDDYKKAKI